VSHSMCELTHGMAGERHGHGMLCVNPPLGVHQASKRGFHFGIAPIYKPKVNSNRAECTKRFQRKIPYIREDVSRESSVDTATRYGMHGSGIETRLGGETSAPVQTGPGAHPASYTMGSGSFPGVKRPGRGVDHPHQVPRLKKE
jgi:hypothetical protein